MGGYFKSWPRLIGVVALIPAFVFAIGMVRSRTIGDRFTIYTSSLTGETIRSENGYLEYASWKGSRARPGQPSFIQWDRWPLVEVAISPDEDDGRFEYQFRCVLFGLGRDGGGGMSTAHAHRIWFVSYWFVVIPLTALSAYLLCKPSSSDSLKKAPPAPTVITSRRLCRFGYLTGVIAILFGIAWLRSYFFADQIGLSFDLHHRMCFYESINGGIRWKSFILPADADPTDTEIGEDVWEENGETVEDAAEESDLTVPTYHGGKVFSRTENPTQFISPGDPDSDFRMRFLFMGFGVGDIVAIDGATSVPGTVWITPYWSLVGSLSLVSGWLLRSQMRAPLS